MKPLTRLFFDAREHFSCTETLRRYHVVQAAIYDLYMRGFGFDDGNKRVSANKMSRGRTRQRRHATPISPE